MILSSFFPPLPPFSLSFRLVFLTRYYRVDSIKGRGEEEDYIVEKNLEMEQGVLCYFRG